MEWIVSIIIYLIGWLTTCVLASEAPYPIPRRWVVVYLVMWWVVPFVHLWDECQARRQPEPVFFGTPGVDMEPRPKFLEDLTDREADALVAALREDDVEAYEEQRHGRPTPPWGSDA